MFIWTYLLAPILYPILSAPILVISMIAKPLQIILVLVITGLLQIHFIAAAVFVGLASAYYLYHVMTPPSVRSAADYRVFSQWQAAYGGSVGLRFAQAAFTIGLLLAFLIAFTVLPDFQPILRWLAALGLSYYTSGVLMGYVTVIFGPSLPAFPSATQD